MSSKPETILDALRVSLSGGSFAAVRRNGALPELVPDDGLVVLRDGDPGEPEVTLSPLTYHFEWRAEIELFAPIERFDALKLEVGARIAADRTLGGLCDWIEAGPPQTDDLALEGSPELRVALIPVRLIFASSDPLA